MISMWACGRGESGGGTAELQEKTWDVSAFLCLCGPDGGHVDLRAEPLLILCLSFLIRQMEQPQGPYLSLEACTVVVINYPLPSCPWLVRKSATVREASVWASEGIDYPASFHAQHSRHRSPPWVHLQNVPHPRSHGQPHGASPPNGNIRRVLTLKDLTENRARSSIWHSIC